MDIQFLGATREVTGSCSLIRIGDYTVLVDCGLLQGSHDHEAHNHDPFPFRPDQIDAVIVTHAHIDHSGKIPLLTKRGYTGPVYSQDATSDLCRIMLADSGYLHEREAEWENRRRHKNRAEPVEPLYTLADATAAHRQFRKIPYDRIQEILPGVTLKFHDAGHILGSAIAELVLTEGERTRTLVFTGDLGHQGAPILADPTPLASADLVVMESTYGDRLHRPWEDTWQELGEVIANARASRGNILIPAFTVGRTQELLYVFKQNYHAWGLDHWQIFLDSPMAIDATDIYQRHWPLYNQLARNSAQPGETFELPNLHLTETAEESMGINRFRTGAIIIAGSGMCTGGRIRHHLRYNIERKDTHVIVVGFQARGTPGRALVDGTDRLRLFGEEYRVAANVHTIGGLSAHADQAGLLDWYHNFEDTPPVVLVHGEEDAMTCLAGLLEAQYGVTVTLAKYQQRLKL